MAGSPGQLRRFGALLRHGVEGAAEADEGGEPAIHPLAVDGDEDLFGNREVREVGRQDHRPEALARPGGVDRLQRDAQAHAR